MEGPATERRRPLLLGEAPSRTGDRYYRFPLSGAVAERTCRLAGIAPQPEGSRYGVWTWALYDHFECHNVFRRYADATPWSVPSARDTVRLRIDQLRDSEVHPVDSRPGEPQTQAPVIVCLGRKVQRAVHAALGSEVPLTTSLPSGAWSDTHGGDFGCWAAPWDVSVPRARRTCSDCGYQPFSELDVTPCLVDLRSGRHDLVDVVEHRGWAPWVVTIPHPSGLNRLLNDPDTRARCGATLRRAMFLADMDGRVAEWHESGHEQTIDLHEFLGLTWDEYRSIT